MRLMIVIVNYRSASLTIDCLRSAESEVCRIKDCEVVVVENASGEASLIASAIERNGWTAWCRLIELSNNGGFAAGNNAAIRPAMQSNDPPDFYLLLNPDTIVHPNAIRSILEFMKENPSIGIAGSRLEERDGAVQRSAFRFPSALGELENTAHLGIASRLLGRFAVAPESPTIACECDWVAGASMMVRRDVFEQVGLMDEGYFLYYEEVDFCRRAKLAGWPCWYFPESRVIHLVGQSSGVTNSNAATKRRPTYWYQSRMRYFVRHRGRFGFLLADLACIVGTGLYSAKCLLLRRKIELPMRFVRDLVANSIVCVPFQSMGQN